MTVEHAPKSNHSGPRALLAEGRLNNDCIRLIQFQFVFASGSTAR